MNARLAGFVAVGLAVVAAMIGAFLYITRGSHLVLTGSILKVRTLPVEDKVSIAVVDFRFVNPSDLLFVVKSVEVIVETADGKELAGETISEPDARRVFQYHPLLGQKYNDSLSARTKIEARESLDRMIAARFEAPESVLAARKRLRLRITDVDGPMSELAESSR
jgi:hypothetical protein